jgi:hypothetical protein
MFNNEEYENSMRQFRDELDDTIEKTDDDDLTSFLDDLGISLN